MKAVYIMLTYNGGELPINAINSILNVEGEDTPIILVDNGSKPEYTDWLKEQLNRWGFKYINEGFEKEGRSSKHILYKLRRNYLFAGGNRKGLKLSLMLGYDIGIFTNDDVVLKKPVISDIVDIFQKWRDVGIVGPNVVNAKRETSWKAVYEFLYPEVIFIRLFMGSRFSLFVRQFLLEKIIPEKHPSGGYIVPWVSGAFFGARLRPLWDSLGLRYRRFLGAEEYEISQMMERIGYLTLLFPDMGEILHMEGMTTGNRGYTKYIWGDIEAISKVKGVEGKKDIFYRLLGMCLYNMGLTPVGLWHKLKNLGRRG